MTPRRAAPVLLALVLLVPLAACGIPKDSRPRLIAEEPEGFATSTEPATDQGSEDLEVFLIDTKADPVTLAGRPRSTTQAPSPLVAVDKLLEGVTKRDEADAYQTRIPPDTELLPNSAVQGDLVTLDLSDEFLTIARDVALQAYAQLVYTATQYGATTVRFMSNGKVVPVATDDETKDVVDRTDYRSLEPET